ncbi:MAG TPA: hypothetical protein VGW12_06070 [Pyrinomonadaceae bacterium]|nr:hypothetical protein [Pyrinomonadaceae bacterium]
MPEMAKYSKAYPAAQFRQFPGWSELTTPATVTAEDEETGIEQTVEYYFLHDDYVVTSGIFRDEQIAFDAVTDEWKQFCHDTLSFDPNGTEGTANDTVAAAHN